MKTDRFTGKTKRLLLPFIILGAAALVFVLLVKTKPDTKPIEKQEKAWTVSAIAAEPVSASPTLTLYGKIDSLWTSNLTAAVAAEVLTVKVIEGNVVQKSDLLLVLDDSDARLELLQKEADVKEAQAKLTAQEIHHQSDLKNLPKEQKLLQLSQNEVARLTGLVEKKVSSQSALDTAKQAVKRQEISVSKLRQTIAGHESKLMELEARLLRAQALRDKAQLNLERTQVRAPYNASVIQVLVSPGRRVRVGDTLLEVFDIDTLIFRAAVPEPYVSVIANARLTGSDLVVKGVLDKQPVSASLLSLAAQTSKISGSIEGIFKLEGENAQMQKGRLTKLHLTLPRQENVILLPHEAMYGPDHVYKLSQDDRLELVKVERVGEIMESGTTSKVLIRAEALKAGDRILTTQLPNAVQGLLVRVVKDG